MGQWSKERRRIYMRWQRSLIALYTGLKAHQYEALPKELRGAVREYVNTCEEPRSPYASMYGCIREQFGFEWQDDGHTHY